MEKNISPVFRIDERVFITMIFISGLFLLLLLYSYRSDKACEPVTLSFKASDFYAGSLIRFIAEAKDGKTYEWDFGDKTTDATSGSSTTHVYEAPGIYPVRVQVNGRCLERVRITIMPRPIFVIRGEQPAIICPKTIAVNRTVIFKDTTVNANRWEWYFDETGAVNSTMRQASWIFTEPGPKTVFLRVNGRPEMEARKTIMVIANRQEPVIRPARPRGIRQQRDNVIPIRPDSVGMDRPAPEEARPVTVEKAPEIQADQMEALLLEVVKGTKTAGHFSKYLCENLEIPVVYNKVSMTFNEMCYQLRQIKKVNRIKRPIVLIRKEEASGCIRSIDITIQKKPRIPF